MRTRTVSFILSSMLLLGALVFAVPQTQASGNLKVTNKDGVMYVTTENDVLAQANTATISGTPSPQSAIILRQPIEPGRGFAPDISTVINFLLRVVMVIAILLVFAHLIIAGIQWITSGGEKGKTEAARNKIIAAIVGLVILAGSYAILMIVIRFLGFTDLPSVLNSVGTINNPNTSLTPTTTVIYTATPTPIATPTATPALRELLP
jgi:hypothetical protein